MGYQAIHRRLLDHWIWQEKPFDKGKAWVDLILLANHKNVKIYIKGGLVEVKRGQLFRSQEELCKRWGWSRNKLRRYTDVLKTEQMVDIQTNHIGTLITIINYDRWQNGKFQAEQLTKQGTKQQKDSRRTPNNNDNNDNNIYTHNIYEESNISPLVTKWEECKLEVAPLDVPPGEIYRLLTKAVKRWGVARVADSFQRYASALKKKEYFPHIPSTLYKFLQDEYGIVHFIADDEGKFNWEKLKVRE